MSLIRWVKGFFETGQAQAMTYLVTFILSCSIVFLVVAFALNLDRISFGVAGVIAGVITAIGGVIAYVLRRGDDVRETTQ